MPVIARLDYYKIARLRYWFRVAWGPCWRHNKTADRNPGRGVCSVTRALRSPRGSGCTPSVPVPWLHIVRHTRRGKAVPIHTSIHYLKGNVMSDVRVVLDDILSLAREGAEQGLCTCAVFRHVAHNEGFHDAVDTLITHMDAIARLARPDEFEAAIGHYLTAVIALGYSLGAADAYETTLRTDITVPDSLAALDYIEPLDRPNNG